MSTLGITESPAFKDIYLDVAINTLTHCGGFIFCQFSQSGTMFYRLYTYRYIYVCVYIYIYIYVERERQIQYLVNIGQK